MFDRLKEAKKEKELNRQKIELLKLVMSEDTIKAIGEKALLAGDKTLVKKMTEEQAKKCYIETSCAWYAMLELQKMLCKDMDLVADHYFRKQYNDFTREKIEDCRKNGYKPYFTIELIHEYTNTVKNVEKVVEQKERTTRIANGWNKFSKDAREDMTVECIGVLGNAVSQVFTYSQLYNNEYRSIMNLSM